MSSLTKSIAPRKFLNCFPAYTVELLRYCLAFPFIPHVPSIFIPPYCIQYYWSPIKVSASLLMHPQWTSFPRFSILWTISKLSAFFVIGFSNCHIPFDVNIHQCCSDEYPTIVIFFCLLGAVLNRDIFRATSILGCCGLDHGDKLIAPLAMAKLRVNVAMIIAAYDIP